MVHAALARDDDDLAAAPYRVLENWQKDYAGNLLIILPDTYGTEQFLEKAPGWLNYWTGVRIDSGDPVAIGEHVIKWWKSHGQDPGEKLMIFSDGLDTAEITRLHGHFAGRVGLGFGWGTLLTNDFRGMAPNGGLDPFSLVCKVISADGRPTVKLSDNPNKAMGPAGEIERYKRVFGIGQQEYRKVVV